MNNFKKYGIITFTVLIMGIGAASTFAKADKKSPPAAPPASTAPAAAADANPVVDRGWAVRCNKPEKGQKEQKQKDCEIFGRLEMQKSGMRMTEFAIGFPAVKGTDKKVARGIMILPLGISLEPGVTLKVDDGKPSPFKVSFCTTGGCVANVDLNKDLLDSLHKGKAINLFFKTSDGRDVQLIMGLTGFEKSYTDAFGNN